MRISDWSPDWCSSDLNGTDSSLEYNMGYGLFGAGGYRFRNGLRLEGEIGYGSVGLDSFRYGGTGGNADGDLQLWSATGAAYYDLPTAGRGRTEEHLGGKECVSTWRSRW